MPDLNNSLVEHYHSWMDNWTGTDYTECCSHNAKRIIDRLHANREITVLKLYVLEEPEFFPYDQTSVDAMLAANAICQSRGGFVEIHWGSLPHYTSDRQRLQHAGVGMIDDYHLPLWLSCHAWMDNLQRTGVPTQLFNMLNNKPKLHRAIMLDELAKHDLIKGNLVSWRDDLAYHPTGERHSWQYHTGDKIIPDEVGSVLSQTLGMSWHMPRQYFNTVFDLVPESTAHVPFFSEKTWRPLLFERPFIAMAWPGYHRDLQALGFELYDEIFDYDFDREEDMSLRAASIAAQLTGLHSSMDFTALRSKCARNRQRVINHKNLWSVPDFYTEFYSRKWNWWMAS